MKSIIVAYDKSRGIGAKNDLLWQRDLPADLKHFREITTGHTVIMGRKTFESIGRALPNRQNIVVTSKDLKLPGIECVSSLDEAYKQAANDQVFVIGGGMIYKLALDTADRIYATEVDAIFDQADVFFPEINSSEWTEVSRQSYQKDDN